jgi:hypothetical protein
MSTEPRPNFPVFTTKEIEEILDPRPTPAELNRVCRHCGQDTLRITKVEYKDKTIHLRGHCTVCNKFSHCVPRRSVGSA